MKFLHSPSSSSSSSSDTRPIYAPAGCIPALLRRLLCFHTLPTFPLDNNIKETYVNDGIEEVYCGDEVKTSVGIVGKLMGLDSMPGGSISDQLKLRKQRKYVLNAPTFVEVENDKFIILSFEGGMNCSKTRKGLIKSKKSDKEKVICDQSVDNHGEDISSCKLSNLGKKLKKLCDPECVERGISRKENIESDSENSSPVSVLEFSDHQEASYSGKDGSQSKNSNSRRKLRGDLDKNASSSSSSSSSSSCSRTSSCNRVNDGEELCTNGKEYVGLEKKSVMNGECKEMWKEICKMTEREVMDSSKVHMERWKGGDYEEIGVCFGLQILDQLILEILFTMT